MTQSVNRIQTQSQNEVNRNNIEFKSKIKYPFMMIPVEIEKMELDVYARAVYQRVQYRAGGHSSHFESQENMAKALFISTRQIMRKMKELEEKKMIHVEKRGRNKDGHFLTNVVTLLDPLEWAYPHHVTHSHTAMCTTVTPPCDSQSHITRSQEELDLNLTINAAEQKRGVVIQDQRGEKQKPATVVKAKEPDKVKRPRYPSTMKTWDKKSEDERMDTVLNMAVDAHRLAVDRRRAAPAPFNDFPDVLLPIIKNHKIELIKDFFTYLKRENLGCDIRKLEQAIKGFEIKILQRDAL